MLSIPGSSPVHTVTSHQKASKQIQAETRLWALMAEQTGHQAIGRQLAIHLCSIKKIRGQSRLCLSVMGDWFWCHDVFTPQITLLRVCIGRSLLTH